MNHFGFFFFKSPTTSQHNSPQHVPLKNNQQQQQIQNNTNLNNIDQVIFRDGSVNSLNDGGSSSITTATTQQSINNDDDNEPIAPIRPPIHSKTKNWYSGFCNRWASLIGVSNKTKIYINTLKYIFLRTIKIYYLFFKT